MKFSVLDPDRKEVSTIQYTKQDHKLEFTNFPFSDFDFEKVSGIV
jgi:hypothetical protein